VVEGGGHDACRIILYLDKYSTHLIIRMFMKNKTVTAIFRRYL